MKTYLEKILPHPENPELSVIFKAKEDDVDPSTLGDSYMEESVADEIQLKFYGGNKAAWFTAEVVVCDKGDEENLQNYYGEDSLGGCNYHTFEDFMKSEQFGDMVKNATEDFMKTKQAHASGPSWHELTEHAIVFGTEEQFKLAQEFEEKSPESATFLPCIIGENGYEPFENYPTFILDDGDDGSYEEMVNNGELDPNETSKEKFLIDCLKATMEENWSPDLKPEDEEEEQSTESSVPVMTVKDLTDGLGLNDDDCEMIIQNDGNGASFPVCKVKAINGYTTIIAANCAPKDAYDYLGFLQALGHFNDSSEIVVLIDNPVNQGEFLITSIEELDKKIILHVEDSRSVAKVQASEVSWEEISPDVWVLGNAKQVECAIQDGDIPLEIPCIAHGNGFEPLSEVPDYKLEDFLADYGSEESSKESKMEQMKHVLGKSYNPEAYSNMVEHEVEEEEGLVDFNSSVADISKKFSLLTNEDATGKKLKDHFLKNLTKHLNDYHKLYGQEALEQSLEKLCLDFASNNGVTFEDKGNTLLFVQKGLEGYAKQPKIDEAISSRGFKTDVSDMDIDNPDQYTVQELQDWYDYHAPQEITWEELEEVNKPFYDKMEQIHQLIKDKKQGLAGKKTVASDKCLTHTFSDAEFDFDLEGVEDEDFVPPKYDIEVEQCFEYDSDYGADADGNRGRATWFFGDREILSISKDGKDVDLKSEEGKNLVDKIEKDKDFEKMVERHDWNLRD